ncbi:type II toxin-antitoxin system RelE/ParE family toxin [Anaerovibrio sp.]|uniref:type II toxin-antitoxin system RelE/ParE family toxin n=1 Tax=Anaerovibrio sp. TaxID=1872532 RepID=UPI003F13CFFB
MIYEIIITEQADADLRGIYEYIAFELMSPDNAAGQLERLEDSITGLEKFPEKFKVYEKEPWHGRGLRVMPVDSYLVFYIVNKELGNATILRVMYAGRDVDKQLHN